MVKRKVKLAQVLCATYSLSNPTGASRSDIIKFCAVRFGFNSKPREYEVVLRQAVDSGLLICFRRRYRLARMGCTILWTEDKKGCNRSSLRHRGRRERDIRGHAQAKSINSLRHRRKHTSPTKRAKRHMAKRTGFKNKSLKATSTLCKLWCKEKRRRELKTGKQDRRDASRMKKIGRKSKLALRRSSHQPRNHLLTPHSGRHKSRSHSTRIHKTRSHRSRSHRPRSHRSGSHRPRSRRSGSIRSQRSQPANGKKSLVKPSSSRRMLYKGRGTQRKSKHTLNRRQFKSIIIPKHQVLNKVPSKRHQKLNNTRPIDLNSINILNHQEIKNNLRSRQEHPKTPYDRSSLVTSSQEYVTAQTSQSSIGSSHAQNKEESEDENVMNKDEQQRRMLRLTKEAVPHAESWDRLNQLRMRRQVENQELIKCSKLVQKILTREHGKSWDDLNEQLRQMKGTKSQPEVAGPGGESSEVERTGIVDPKVKKAKSYYSNGRHS